MFVFCSNSDIDECSEATDDCQQTCSNTPGGYTCSCVLGYDLNSDAKTCTQGVFMYVVCVTDVYQHTWRLHMFMCVRLRPEFWFQDLHSRCVCVVCVTDVYQHTWWLRVLVVVRIRPEFWCQDLYSRCVLCNVCNRCVPTHLAATCPHVC